MFDTLRGTIEDHFQRLINSHPVTSELRAAQAAQTLEERLRQRRQFDEVDAEIARGNPLVAREEQARAHVESKQRELEGAQGAFARAQAAAMDWSVTRHQRRSVLEAELRRSAHPAIREFAHVELWALEQQAPGRLLVTESRVDALKRWVSGLSNATSIDTHLAAIRRARATALALELEALSDAEVLERLDAIRASLPPIESAQFVGGELPAA